MTVYLCQSAISPSMVLDHTHSLMIWGCRRSCRYWISRSTRPAMSREMSFLREIIFSATSCPLMRCTASLTLPKEPSPKVFLTWYCPILCSTLPPLGISVAKLRGDTISDGGAGLDGGCTGTCRCGGLESDIDSSSSSKWEAMTAEASRPSEQCSRISQVSPKPSTKDGRSDDKGESSDRGFVDGKEGGG